MAYKRKKEVAFLKLWFNRWTLFEPLNMEQRGRVLTALMHKALNREALQLDQVENLAFYVLSAQMDDDAAHYREVCEKNTNNRNGRTSSTTDDDRQPPTTTHDQNDQTKDQRPKTKDQRPKTKESESSADKPRRTRFVPPTEQEAAAYFAEHDGTAEQAARFCNYYAARGWTTGKGNSPMRDWQAAARNWILRDKDFHNGTTPPQEPSQGRSSWGEYCNPTEADEAIRAFEAAHGKEV